MNWWRSVYNWIIWDGIKAWTYSLTVFLNSERNLRSFESKLFIIIFILKLYLMNCRWSKYDWVIWDRIETRADCFTVLFDCESYFGSFEPKLFVIIFVINLYLMDSRWEIGNRIIRYGISSSDNNLLVGMWYLRSLEC